MFIDCLVLVFGFVLAGRNLPFVIDDPDKDSWGIRCPLCKWRPARADRWRCGPGGCDHVWNTFTTGGKCPGCEKQWANTKCLRCHQWSKHDAWYEDPNSSR